MGGKECTYVANDTDEDLEVSVKYCGMSLLVDVPAHGFVKIPTCNRYQVKIGICVSLRSGHPAWISRTLYNSNGGLLIRKREPHFVLYKSKSSDMWQIDTKDMLNKDLGF